MEHLKTIMNKLDDMWGQGQQVMNDGDYKILMEELKSAYDKHNIGKFVNQIRLYIGKLNIIVVFILIPRGHTIPVVMKNVNVVDVKILSQ